MPPTASTLPSCLRQGDDAGVVLFHRTEADRRTFLAHPLSVVGSDGSAIPLDAPTQAPIGVTHVMVNGGPVVEDGRHSDLCLGRVLRRASGR
jgi:hypothetical protein